MKLSRLLCVAALLAVSACTPEMAVAPAVSIESAAFASSLGINLANFSKSSTGLYSQDVTAGGGAAAVSGNHLTVHYTGDYTRGTTFDTSIGKTAFGFTLGAGSVIKGWDEGLVGMKVGGTRKLIVPPSLGCGAGVYNGIPANSILVFQVQLVSIP